MRKPPIHRTYRPTPSRLLTLLGYLSVLCLLPLALLPASGCSSKTCSGDFSDFDINPNGSPCQQKCECNNRVYHGLCDKGSCSSIKREACPTPGAKRICLGIKTECVGRQTCQPTYLTSLLWGDCVCDSSEKPTNDAGSETTNETEPQPPEANEPQSEPQPPEPTCKDGQKRNCYPTGTPGCTQQSDGNYTCTSPCNTGIQTCTQGLWGSCQNAQLPQAETCDGKDQDCDGKPDQNAPDCVTTFAGDGTKGSADGKGTKAQFHYPHSIAIDKSGNLTISDMDNHSIRKIDSEGNVTTIAGGSPGMLDGKGTQAQFNSPRSLAIDKDGNLYIVDTNNNAIRKMDKDGNVTTIAGNGTPGFQNAQGTNARFNSPEGIAINAQNELFVSDRLNHCIRKIDTTGNVTTYLGLCKTSGTDNGQGANARFNEPHGLSIGPKGNLYISDLKNNLIRKADANGNVTTYAGDGTNGNKNGPALQAQFRWVNGMSWDKQNSVLFLAESFGFQIRKLVDATATVSVLLGSTEGQKDGPPLQAQTKILAGVLYDPNSKSLFFADHHAHKIRRYRFP